MKTAAQIVIFLCLTAVTNPQTPPSVVNYQGRVTRANGQPLPDGTVKVEVNIYDSPSAGNLLWDSGEKTVIVRSGVFALALQGNGATKPALGPATFASGFTWFEVVVWDGATRRPLSPRQLMAGVPWSLWASTVSDGAITNAKLATDRVSLGVMTGNDMYQTADHRIGVGTTEPYSLLEIRGANPRFTVNSTLGNPYPGIEFRYAGAPRAQLISDESQGALIFNQQYASSDWSYRFQFMGAEKLRITGDGKVGIGTGNPLYLLDVVGTVQGQSNGAAGVRGISPSGQDGGVYGSGGFFGVKGIGGQYGVYGTSDSNNYASGVVGIALADNGFTRGGDFECRSQAGYGVRAVNTTSGNGLHAESNGGYAASFSGNVLVYAGNLEVNTNAYKPGGGDWGVLSDARLKKNIARISDPAGLLLRLRGTQFQYKNPESIHERTGTLYGFIAQEVEAEFPNWVVTGSSGYKTVNLPADFNALVVEAFREQQWRINTLEAQLGREKSARMETQRRLAKLEQVVMSQK